MQTYTSAQAGGQGATGVKGVAQQKLTTQHSEDTRRKEYKLFSLTRCVQVRHNHISIVQTRTHFSALLKQAEEQRDVKITLGEHAL